MWHILQQAYTEVLGAQASLIKKKHSWIFKYCVLRKTKVIITKAIIIDSVSQGYIDDKDTKLTSKKLTFEKSFILPN